MSAAFWVESRHSATMAFFQIAAESYCGYDADAMTQMDWENERQRLAARCADMADDELRKVARDIRFLTALARETLRAEMSKRGILTANESLAAESDDDSRHISVKPVIIRKYRDLPGASIAKSVLESAAIECFLGLMTTWCGSTASIPTSSPGSNYSFGKKTRKQQQSC